MARQPCIECKRRPPVAPRRRCATCQLRHEPIGDQVTAARLRLAMVPEPLRLKRSPKLQRLAPEGTAWCAGCQSWRDHEDFGKSATTCRACSSAKAHAAMVEKVYGLSADGYAALLEVQGGKCAICRARPKSKRLAVDHDHKTTAVRGLLCSRCNHDLMGAAWDSSAMALALWHYINTPPTSGTWVAPELGLATPDAQRPAKASAGLDGLVSASGAKLGEAAAPRQRGAILADGWEEQSPGELHAAWAALAGAIARVDPAPF